MRIGQANIDFEGLQIESPAGHTSMEPKIMDVLQVLVDNANRVVTRSDIIDSVWGVGFGGDERLSRAISILRKALGDSKGNNTYIKTIPRRGYKLIAEIRDFEIEPHSETVVSLSGANKSEKNSPSIPIDTPSAAVIDKTPTTKPPTKNRSAIVLAVAALLAVIVWVGPLSGLGTASKNLKVNDGLQLVHNYTSENAIPQAQELFSNILAENPDHAAGRAGFALALIREYTHLERDPALLRRAKSYAEAALRADDHLALANIAVGWVAEFEGNYEQALGQYDRADILDPENAFTLEGRIRTYFKQGKSEDVRQQLDTAISLFPNNSTFHSYYGQFLTSENAYSDAEVMFRKLVVLSPENPRAYAQLAQSLHLQDRTQEGVKILQDGLKVNETATLYNNLGTYLFFQGQYEMAAQAFERTLELKGDSHEYLYWANLGDSYRQIPSRLKKANSAYDRALQLLEEEISKSENNPTLNSRAALYYAKRGRLSDSRRALSKVPLNETSSASEFYRAVVIYEILSERDLALNMLKLAISKGYPKTEILNDPELFSLRQDPAYHQMVTINGE